jgi:hypothetical protein
VSAEGKGRQSVQESFPQKCVVGRRARGGAFWKTKGVEMSVDWRKSKRQGWPLIIRNVLAAKPIQGMSPEEIAARMGMKLERVRKYLSNMQQYGEIERIQEARILKVIKQPSIYRVKQNEEQAS